MTPDIATERAAARVGTLLRGKWRLDRLIGVGGMAAVYAATHRNGAPLAIKMLHPEYSFDEGVRERFRREGCIGNSFQHQGVVLVLDDDEDVDGTAFLVMELLDGETLEERRRRQGGVVDVVDLLLAMDQLLSVLHAAHSNGVIHRDLKPENVFLTTGGVVKVLDFGIAKVRRMATTSGLTRTGTAMGTPAYMAPEQALGNWESVDAQSDIWSVGATMFMLLTGRLVHEAPSLPAQLIAASSRPARSLASVGSFPRALVNLVDHALYSEKRNRWPNAITMQEALRHTYYAMFGDQIWAAPRLQAPSRSALSAPASTSEPRTLDQSKSVGRTAAKRRAGQLSVLSVLMIAAVTGALCSVFTAVLLRYPREKGAWNSRCLGSASALSGDAAIGSAPLPFPVVPAQPTDAASEPDTKQ